RRPVWKALVQAIDAEGWRLVGLLRLASLIPGAATNYLLGVTRIGLLPDPKVDARSATGMAMNPKTKPPTTHSGGRGANTIAPTGNASTRPASPTVPWSFQAWAK